jgi:hypothetical protein
MPLSQSWPSHSDDHPQGTYTAFGDPGLGSSMRAYDALSLFASVRPDEIKKLGWSDITLFPSATRTVEWTLLDLEKGDSLFVSKTRQDLRAKRGRRTCCAIATALTFWSLRTTERSSPLSWATPRT